MRKSRDPGRSKPPSPDDPTKPAPDQAEVERAIRSVVERLKPKARKDKPMRKAHPLPRFAAQLKGRIGS